MSKLADSSSSTLSGPALALLWFGAAVSLAEILTGSFIAPLGFEQGVLAIVLGHLIGGVLFWLAGYIGAQTGKSAMETVKRSFGQRGSMLFSLANVVQLVGWTAIMVASGAAAAQFLVPQLGTAAWALIIGVLIALWIVLELKNMSRLQSVTAVLLFLLTIVLSFVVFNAQAVHLPPNAGQTLAFGAAVELAVAMPLSWLPLVSDYTRSAKRAGWGTTWATVAYFIGSCWMFIIGLGATLYAGSGDIAAIMSAAGLGVAAILIVVFSTVTTTFMDAASAGISAASINPKLNERWAGIVAVVLGTALAIFAPVNNFEAFLYLIGSVFAPMIAIMCADYFLLKTDVTSQAVCWRNLALWCAGFALYRYSMTWDFVLGNTLPVMLIVAASSFAIGIVSRKFRPAAQAEAA
ncbi:putative hydroxymethylpyrimidine transporter CytX [Chitinibacter fontanus]|uniref:Putative hydroxymethylpyrimidine transporter CytX n=1 Tax=Chitinibacter fontanus TaxID=1737446 RepID=A0A7D5VAS5_9NEIS|nr:putative hydroxymethylpyrimidine transporter CytX [Chitinibacter fontanus]QLI82431.1 putative hydroxymethylpyrimidine transporter CytX [Chitinibacter fontanus]